MRINHKADKVTLRLADGKVRGKRRQIWGKKINTDMEKNKLR